MANRNIQLDIIRCIALFLIILCHTQIGLENVSPGIVKLKWFVGKCGVPLFFIISGYLNLPMKYGDMEFISKRFKRVFIPFLFWCIIYRVLSAIFENGALIRPNSEDLFLIATSAHLWYIYAILALYMITPIISEYFHKCSQKMFQFYLIVWLASTTFTYYYHLTGHTFFDHNITYITYYIGGYLGYYILGYYIKRFNPIWIFGNWNLKNCLILGSIFLIGIIFIYAGYFHLNMTTVEISSYVTIVPVLFSILAFSILWKIRVTNDYIMKVINSLSKYSFGIYLIHEAVIYYIFPLFFRDVCGLELNGIVVLLINLLVVSLNIVISYFIVRLVNLLPKSKFIFG
ncbi:acyltransferase [Dysgonomonas termitidis]|uniref:Acyltransferase n=1 Tax=Dysgonomonas termitidis TaxID=1516126 RepID=A0ABV9KXX6_9BACT